MNTRQMRNFVFNGAFGQGNVAASFLDNLLDNTTILRKQRIQHMLRLNLTVAMPFSIFHSFPNSFSSLICKTLYIHSSPLELFLQCFLYMSLSTIAYKKLTMQQLLVCSYQSL